MVDETLTVYLPRLHTLVNTSFVLLPPAPSKGPAERSVDSSRPAGSAAQTPSKMETRPLPIPNHVVAREKGRRVLRMRWTPPRLTRLRRSPGQEGPDAPSVPGSPAGSQEDYAEDTLAPSMDPGDRQVETLLGEVLTSTRSHTNNRKVRIGAARAVGVRQMMHAG